MKRKTPLKRYGKPLKRTPLKPASPKRAAQLKEYSRLRKAFLAEHPRCEVRLHAQGRELQPFGKPSDVAMQCPMRSDDVHHRAGRMGKMLLDVRFLMAACRSCHDFLHSNANEARRLGYLITKTQ